MERKIVKTGDGSTTIQITEWNEQYHSMHGAVQEAQHVFLKMGLDYIVTQNPHLTELNILEIGFGTGLNALLTLTHAAQKQIALPIMYEGIEAYPVLKNELDQLNYFELIDFNTAPELFEKMHNTAWEQAVAISQTFNLKKRKQTFETIVDKNAHHLIYFDAFGARVQPELWEQPIFRKMYEALSQNGVLVTYAAKGSVRRAMQAVGFKVERLPGPPGKREMLRAVKI